MEKVLFILFSTVLSTSLYAQEDIELNNPKHEIKLNMTNIIAFKWFDVGYEYILNEESSIGVGTLISLDPNDNTGLDEYRTFSLTPYYRHFFSRKYAQGFFVEAFTMLHSGKEDIYYDNIDDSYKVEGNYTDLAIGVSAGGKFITKRGFIAEIYLGLGRDMLGQSDIEVVGRGGIALGFRF